MNLNNDTISFTVKAKTNKELFDKINEGINNIPLKEDTWYNLQCWGERMADDTFYSRVYVTEHEPKDK